MDNTVEELLTRICEHLPALGETELKVLLQITRIAHKARGAGVAFSLTELIQATGLRNRDVMAAVQSLTSRGLLRCHQQRDARGGYLTTRYALPSIARRPGVQDRQHAHPVQDIQARPWFNVPLPERFSVEQAIWELCLRNVHRSEPTLIIGPTGCGKTELVAYLARATGRRLYRINMGATTDARAALIGVTHFTGGETTFVEATFVKGIQDPRGLIRLDELNRGAPEANNFLFPVLDGQKYIAIDESRPPRIVRRHPQASVFATGNSGWGYVGTHALDRALQDRFSTIVQLDYPPQDAEVDLLIIKQGLAKQDAQGLVAFAHKCRAMWRRGDLSTPVSTRALVKVAGKIVDGFPRLLALEHTVFPLFEAEEQEKVRHILQSV